MGIEQVDLTELTTDFVRLVSKHKGDALETIEQRTITVALLDLITALRKDTKVEIEIVANYIAELELLINSNLTDPYTPEQISTIKNYLAIVPKDQAVLNDFSARWESILNPANDSDSEEEKRTARANTVNGSYALLRQDTHPVVKKSDEKPQEIASPLEKMAMAVQEFKSINDSFGSKLKTIAQETPIREITHNMGTFSRSGALQLSGYNAYDTELENIFAACQEVTQDSHNAIGDQLVEEANQAFQKKNIINAIAVIQKISLTKEQFSKLAVLSSISPIMEIKRIYEVLIEINKQLGILVQYGEVLANPSTNSPKALLYIGYCGSPLVKIGNLLKSLNPNDVTIKAAWQPNVTSKNLYLLVYTLLDLWHNLSQNSAANLVTSTLTVYSGLLHIIEYASENAITKAEEVSPKILALLNEQITKNSANLTASGYWKEFLNDAIEKAATSQAANFSKSEESLINLEERVNRGEFLVEESTRLFQIIPNQLNELAIIIDAITPQSPFLPPNLSDNNHEYNWFVAQVAKAIKAPLFEKWRALQARYDACVIAKYLTVNGFKDILDTANSLNSSENTISDEAAITAIAALVALTKKVKDESLPSQIKQDIHQKIEALAKRFERFIQIYRAKLPTANNIDTLVKDFEVLYSRFTDPSTVNVEQKVVEITPSTLTPASDEQQNAAASLDTNAMSIAAHGEDAPPSRSASPIFEQQKISASEIIESITQQLQADTFDEARKIFEEHKQLLNSAYVLPVSAEDEVAVSNGTVLAIQRSTVVALNITFTFIDDFIINFEKELDQQMQALLPEDKDPNIAQLFECYKNLQLIITNKLLVIYNKLEALTSLANSLTELKISIGYQESLISAASKSIQNYLKTEKHRITDIMADKLSEKDLLFYDAVDNTTIDDQEDAFVDALEQPPLSSPEKASTSTNPNLSKEMLEARLTNFELFLAPGQEAVAAYYAARPLLNDDETTLPQKHKDISTELESNYAVLNDIYKTIYADSSKNTDPEKTFNSLTPLLNQRKDDVVRLSNELIALNKVIKTRSLIIQSIRALSKEWHHYLNDHWRKNTSNERLTIIAKLNTNLAGCTNDQQVAKTFDEAIHEVEQSHQKHGLIASRNFKRFFPTTTSRLAEHLKKAKAKALEGIPVTQANNAISTLTQEQKRYGMATQLIAWAEQQYLSHNPTNQDRLKVIAELYKTLETAQNAQAISRAIADSITAVKDDHKKGLLGGLRVTESRLANYLISAQQHFLEYCNKNDPTPTAPRKTAFYKKS